MVSGIAVEGFDPLLEGGVVGEKILTKNEINIILSKCDRL